MIPTGKCLLTSLQGSAPVPTLGRSSPPQLLYSTHFSNSHLGEWHCYERPLPSYWVSLWPLGYKFHETGPASVEVIAGSLAFDPHCRVAWQSQQLLIELKHRVPSLISYVSLLGCTDPCPGLSHCQAPLPWACSGFRSRVIVQTPDRQDTVL